MKVKPITTEPYWGCVKITASNEERQDIKRIYEAHGVDGVEYYMNRHIFGGWKPKFWQFVDGITIENIFRQGFVIFKPKAVD